MMKTTKENDYTVEDAKREFNVAQGFRVLYADQLKTLTHDNDIAFATNGTYNQLDAILARQEPIAKTQTDSLENTMRDSATFTALSTAVGAGVGAIAGHASGEMTLGAQYGMIHGAALGAAMSASSHYFGRKIYDGLVDLTSTLFPLVSRREKQQGPPSDDLYKTTMQDAITNPATKARRDLIENIKNFETQAPNPRSSFPRTLFSAMYHAIGNAGYALAFSTLSPTDMDTKMAASIGWLSGMAGSMYNQGLQNSRKAQTHQELLPIIGHLSNDDRKALIGGLVKRWYHSVPEIIDPQPTPPRNETISHLPIIDTIETRDENGRILFVPVEGTELVVERS